MRASRVPDPGGSLPLDPRGMAAPLFCHGDELVVRVHVSMAVKAEELEPFQRLMADRVTVPKVMDMDTSAHPASLTLAARTSDHVTALGLPGEPIFGGFHGGRGIGGRDPPYPVAVGGCAGSPSWRVGKAGRVAPCAALGSSPGSSGDGSRGSLSGHGAPVGIWSDVATGRGVGRQSPG